MGDFVLPLISRLAVLDRRNPDSLGSIVPVLRWMRDFFCRWSASHGVALAKELARRLGRMCVVHSPVRLCEQPAHDYFVPRPYLYATTTKHHSRSISKSSEFHSSFIACMAMRICFIRLEPKLNTLIESRNQLQIFSSPMIRTDTPTAPATQ